MHKRTFGGRAPTRPAPLEKRSLLNSSKIFPDIRVEGRGGAEGEQMSGMERERPKVVRET